MTGRDVNGEEFVENDPLQAPLQGVSGEQSAMEIVTQILAHESIFAPEVRQNSALVARLVEVLER